ncbi:HDOD domain-containing protein [Candidatus Binatia bacterium]|nr:HDOD domain-containing protein [Candidatus Binatia bacterium]
MLDQTLVTKAAAAVEPLPPTVSRLASAMGREDYGLREIEQIIAYDPVLTGRLLRIANSAALSTGAPIATVRAAILKIGAGRVLSYALSGPLSKQLQRPIAGYGLGQGVLWRHLVASALAVELMDGVTKQRVPSEAFAAALLHDLGQVVMAQFLDPRLLQLIQLAKEQGMSSREAEVEILGVHQGEVGALVAQEWKLPDRIVRAIAYAGTTVNGEDILYDFVHLGHVLAGRVGEYPGMPACELEIEPDVAQRVGLAAESVDPLLERIEERLGEVLRIYAA